MTVIKMCGMTTEEDIRAVNMLLPEYIGFVFYAKSKRSITSEKAALLKKRLHSGIKAVGVFVNEEPRRVAGLLNNGIIDMAQLHGTEGEEYIQCLKSLTSGRIIKAFKVDEDFDPDAAERSPADHILLDSGAGSGDVFDWSLISGIRRPYFLAGGLDQDNVADAIEAVRPYAVDVSSGIETDGHKDKRRMTAFTAAVRDADMRLTLMLDNDR